MIYVYAIADRPDEPLPSQLGLHDEALVPPHSDYDRLNRGSK